MGGRVVLRSRRLVLPAHDPYLSIGSILPLYLGGWVRGWLRAWTRGPGRAVSTPSTEKVRHLLRMSKTTMTFVAVGTIGNGLETLQARIGLFRCANNVFRASRVRKNPLRLAFNGGAFVFTGSPTQFHWRSAAPEAFLYGAKSDTGANAEKQWAVRISSISARTGKRSARAYKPPTRLNGDTRTCGVWLCAFGKTSVSSRATTGCCYGGGWGVRTELAGKCQRPAMKTRWVAQTTNREKA